MLVFKILTPDQWSALERDGESPGAPVDLADGYVHLSAADQVAGTLAKHFAGQEGLVLAAFEAGDLGAALRWEVSRGGALFPHLYAPLRRGQVLWTRPLPLAGGTHVLPPEVAP